MNLDQLIPNYPDVTQIAIPFFVIAIVVEIFLLRQLRKERLAGFETRDTLTSLMMGVGNVVAGLLFGFIAFGVLMWAWQFRFYEFGFQCWDE
ncbi:MAG: hypothetical protein AAFO77_15170 [Pseudomonadota bacterium]